MIELKNDILHVQLKQAGAEITSVKRQGEEYIWHGDAAYWARHTPVLFPIVGRLANNQYIHNGKIYSLPQHGFARDIVFDVMKQTNTEVTFRLNANEETKAKYPFDFTLLIRYVLDKDTLSIEWTVENKTDGVMYFSIGAHPAFTVSIEDNDYDEVVMSFKGEKSRESFTFAEGKVYQEKIPVFDGSQIKVTADLFKKFNTIILENEKEIKLHHKNKQITISFENFPYVGMWSPIINDSPSPFVCIEPWFGIADFNDDPGEIKEKVGIQTLSSNEIFQTTYTIAFD